MSFDRAKQIQELLKDYTGTWMIAGGWAIDLFLNRVTREHHDIEIAIPRSEQFLLKSYLKDWKFQYVNSERLIDWVNNKRLELPIHEIHASKENRSLEILLNEIKDETWSFRRNLDIKYPLKSLFLKSMAGIPILSPEIVLLYKAKTLKKKDYLDYNKTLASLSESQKEFLFNAIKVCHGKNHDWILNSSSYL